MDELFTDLFRKEAREIGLDEVSALKVIRSYDKVQELSYEGLALRLFIRRENSDSFVLILAQKELDQLRLLLPFRIRRDLFQNIEVLEPLMVLELVAQNYGLVISVGSRFGRFLYQEDIGIQDSGTQIVSVRNPHDHDFLQSIFVKTLETVSGRVAKCALAFCIDTHLYREWLKADLPDKTRHIQSPSVSRIVGTDVVRRTVASNARESDPGKRFNLTELDLALETIKTVMGQQWYETVLEQYPDTSNRAYQRFVRSATAHPLSEALWSGQPEDYVRIIQLGIFLNQLWRNDNRNRLTEKIKELQQYLFHHTYYELKMSAYFDRRNYEVSFIPREEGLQTPDFRIDSNDGFAFAECKRKDSVSLQIDSDVEKAASQLEGYGGPGVIFVELLTDIDNQAARKMLDRGKQLLEGMKSICLLVITREKSRDEMGTIALGTRAWGVKISDARVQLPASIERASYFQDPISWMPLSQS